MPITVAMRPAPIATITVVRDPAIHAAVLRERIAGATAAGWTLRGVTTSPITGPAGNVEFFLWLTREAAPPLDVEAAIAAALAKVPIVLGTAVFNAVVVQALFFPLRKVLNK